jgi:hypothetical protein
MKKEKNLRKRREFKRILAVITTLAMLLSSMGVLTLTVGANLDPDIGFVELSVAQNVTGNAMPASSASFAAATEATHSLYTHGAAKKHSVLTENVYEGDMANVAFLKFSNVKTEDIVSITVRQMIVGNIPTDFIPSVEWLSAGYSGLGNRARMIQVVDDVYMMLPFGTLTATHIATNCAVITVELKDDKNDLVICFSDKTGGCCKCNDCKGCVVDPCTVCNDCLITVCGTHANRKANNCTECADCPATGLTPNCDDSCGFCVFNECIDCGCCLGYGACTELCTCIECPACKACVNSCTPCIICSADCVNLCTTCTICNAICDDNCDACDCGLSCKATCTVCDDCNTCNTLCNPCNCGLDCDAICTECSDCDDCDKLCPLCILCENGDCICFEIDDSKIDVGSNFDVGTEITAKTTLIVGDTVKDVDGNEVKIVDLSLLELTIDKFFDSTELDAIKNDSDSFFGSLLDILAA